MELVTGQIVISRQGRDVTRVYMVTGFDGDRVLLVDGAKRSLTAPKAKNIRHIQPTGTVLTPTEADTDLKVKKALLRYAKDRGQQQGGV